MQFCAPFSHPRARYIISSIGKYRTQRKHASSTEGNFLIRSRFEISFVFFSCGAWIKEWARMVNIVQCYSESRINQVFLARGSTTSPSLSLSLPPRVLAWMFTWRADRRTQIHWVVHPRRYNIYIDAGRLLVKYFACACEFSSKSLFTVDTINGLPKCLGWPRVAQVGSCIESTRLLI